jgi:choline dehydrogenase-like flavoprotein
MDHPPPPDPLAKSLGRVIADLDAPDRPLPHRPRVFALMTWSEQAPNAESRVTLDDERDTLGTPRVRLDWRLGEIDKHTVRRGHRMIAEDLGRSGMARFKLTLTDDPEFSKRTLGGRHHMGTTRMHPDPKRGVVDANGAVHGVPNLLIAGSSVFPTSGSANPTLTIVALALRMADHLKKALA